MTHRPSARSLLRSATPRRASLVVLSAVLAASLAACGSGSSTGSTGGSKTVSIGPDSDPAPSGYDPLLYSSGQYPFFSALYDSLFVTQQDGTVKPSLVTGAKGDAGNTKLTLTLRKGVTFTDGTTLDATVVKANLDRRDDDTLAAYGVFRKDGAAEITDVAAPDASTVVITFAKPQASAQAALADQAGIIVGGKAAADPATLTTTPDGSGPYTLDTGKTTKASAYTVVKNAKAWSAAGYPYDSMAFKVILDPQARANAYLSGQLDVASIDPTTADFVQSRGTLAKNGGTMVSFLVFDKLGKTSKPFGDPRVRQALLIGVDRKTLVDTLHKGAKATANAFPAAAPGYDPSLDSRYAYDPAKAKDLLAQAGYPQGFTFQTLTSGGTTDTDVQAVQKQWQAIGVTMNIKRAASTDEVFAAVTTMPLGYIATGVGDPLGFVQGVLVGGFANLQQASDPKIQVALDAAAAATGDARTAALKDLNGAIISQGWLIPLYEQYAYYGYNAKKLAAPTFPGTGNVILLPSVQPAS